MDKQEAQRRVFQLRRKALNSAKTGVPVNNPDVRPAVAEMSPDVASESPNVAEMSPDECSICRGRHGSEVQHACE